MLQAFPRKIKRVVLIFVIKIKNTHHWNKDRSHTRTSAAGYNLLKPIIIITFINYSFIHTIICHLKLSWVCHAVYNDCLLRCYDDLMAYFVWQKKPIVSPWYGKLE